MKYENDLKEKQIKHWWTLASKIVVQYNSRGEVRKGRMLEAEQEVISCVIRTRGGGAASG